MKIQLEGSLGSYFVTAVNEHIIRVVYTKNEEVAEPSVLIEARADKKTEVKENLTDQVAVYETSKVRLTVCLADGVCTWQDAETGELLLQEGKKSLVEKDVMRYQVVGEKPIVKRVKTVDGERNFIQNLETVVDRRAFRGKLSFCWQKDEHIYGLGQGEEGIYNYRGHDQYLYQHNMRIPMPMFVSSHHYGILADCSSLLTFNDTDHGSYLFMDTIDQMDYYFVAGKKLDEIIGGFRLLTGHAQMLPKWAFGYVQSKEAYLTQQELVDTVKEYRKRKVPLDCIVQDWLTWEDGKWGNKIVDKKRYPNLKAAMDEIHELHAHTMVSVWPNMNSGTENYDEMMEQGHMLMDLATYNAFDEDARALYWKQAKAELFDGGFDSWWCDSTEPFSGPDWGGEERREAWERYQLVGEEHKKYLDPGKANAFALMHAKGMYENQRKDCSTKRVLNLTRSGYPSIQKYGAVLWSGDTCATWNNLKIQITEGLNMAMSGYPYWTLDIGAFFLLHENWQKRGCNCNTDPSMKWFWNGDYEEGIQDKGYQELYTRWLQYGTFLPMFRSHGTDGAREIWNFGEKGTMFYDAIERFINLRYTLMPYIYSCAADVHFHDSTMMRSLMFDFAEDKKVWDIHDEFMFGPSILVCPITEPMYYGVGSKELQKEKTHTCYLPEGCEWYDFWTGTRYAGGQSVTVSASIDKIPLFVKAGSLIPVSEGIQYADEKCMGDRKVLVYPGKDTYFALYEDAGDGYGFEKGEYRITDLHWDEASQKLLVESPRGKFDGMKENPNYKASFALSR